MPQQFSKYGEGGEGTKRDLHSGNPKGKPSENLHFFCTVESELSDVNWVEGQSDNTEKETDVGKCQLKL